MDDFIKCIPGCGACCIAPSITSPIPGMPQGKPAGVRCANLTEDNLCALFGKPERPGFCGSFAPQQFCLGGKESAMKALEEMERNTK